MIDSHAKKEARQTLRKYRLQLMNDKYIEHNSLKSPFTMTKMYLQRSIIREYITNNPIFIDNIVIMKPSFKLKHSDNVIGYIPYDMLMEQYHRRVMQLFTNTFKTTNNITPKTSNNADNNNNTDSDSDSDSDNDSNSNDDNNDDDNSSYMRMPLEIYDTEKEVNAIDGENYLTAHYDLSEHYNKLNNHSPRILTNQHVYEWLQLIGQQLIPSETLYSGDNIYTKNDIVLYEDEHIMVINKPNNIPVHASFDTGLHFSNSIVNFLLYHCKELKDIQYNAIKMFKESSIDDLLYLCNKNNDFKVPQNKINLRLLTSKYKDNNTILVNSPLEDIIKPGIIHRLDKKTSGLLVIGKTKYSCQYIQEQFKYNEVNKEYLAILHNKLAKPTYSQQNYIERDAKQRNKYKVMTEHNKTGFSMLTRDDLKNENEIRKKIGMDLFDNIDKIKSTTSYTKLQELQRDSIDNDELHENERNINSNNDNINMDEWTHTTAKMAITHFRELETFKYLPKKQRKEHIISLVNCKLKTGRTHQIRVHCMNMKMPVIGDTLYNVKQYNKYETELFDDISGFDDMHCLHNYLLEFKHINGKIGRFTSNPPETFTKCLGKLRTLELLDP